MRVNRFNPARIARALSAVLFISLLQVAVAPVVAPQITTPAATAADANDFPSELGTVYQFLAESYTSGSTTWPEARGGSAATITNNATKVTNTAGTLGASKSVVAVQGFSTTDLTFPTTIGPGVSSNYTLLYVARYAPASGAAYQAGNYCDTVTHNAGSVGKARIFTSVTGNWLSGFWACAAGVAFHEGWLTGETSSVTELSGANGNNWLLGTDCGYTVASTSACKGRYRAFGKDRTTAQSTSTGIHQVGVNVGVYGAEATDFQIAEVISYPTILSVAEIVKVETYLARKYGINLSSSSATKLGVHRASVGTNLNEPLSLQPQIAIQDTNGQTVTTDNSTIITATVTGLNGRVIGTATADAVQGVATFDNLGVDGVAGNTYTITFSSNTGLATTSETRTFTRGGSSETDTALLLNGSNQYADVTDTTGSPYDITGTFTLTAWVNPSTACSGSGVVVSKRSYMLYCQAGVWRVMILADGVGGSGVATSIPVEPNEWHHIAITKNSSSGNVLFYYDGVLVETVNVTTTTMTPNNSPFEIGRYSVLGYYFEGEIDEVRLYNVQRSASQIQSDLNSYATTSDTTLVAYYDFNEPSTTTLFNREIYSTSATDLTLRNSPTRVDVKSVDTTTLAAYTIVRFDRTYITSLGGWKVPANVSRASVLTVAGGGGGGARAAGGGGAGGLRYAPIAALNPGNFETITVGQGGFGASSTSFLRSFQGYNGQDSQFGNRFLTIGGGGGGGAGLASDTERAGRDGGSGGGATGSNFGSGASAAHGLATQATADALGLGNRGGSGVNGAYWNGGGGGGSGGAGANASTTSWVAGNGGAGTLDPIGGSNNCLAAGGGGGTINTGSAAGNGGVCASGTVTAGAGTIGSVVGGHATANSGSGGGGSGYSSGADVAGGNGGSGVIIVRWITASKPNFTQPSIDTTTAGLTDTITVSANPLNPLTRNYRWQVSTDTGTTWANASTGSGLTSNIYTTPVLETNTSGIRYQYRVIVTDSDTAGLFIVDTSVAVYIVVNPRITYTGSYSSHKYGSTHQDTFTVLNGTGNKTFSYSPNNRTGITWSSPLANTAVLTIGPTLFVGTYIETVTATDTRGAQTSLAISIVVSKADTITVTAISRSETYTGSTLSFTPTFTVSGLKNSDTVTASAMSWLYNGVENSGTLYAIQSTRPTNAGNYVITPVAPSSLTDSYTAVTIVPATLTVNRATRTLTLSNIVSPLKFGSFTTFTATPSAGSGDGTITYSTPNSESCTISAPSIRAIKSSGTCFATAVISQGFNFETATSNTVSTTLAKADTLTVTVDTLTATTYTGAQYALTPTVTVAGLKNSNTVGASPVTFQYASIATPLNFATTKPTDADTYTVRASGLTLASGSLSDYQGVEYIDRTLRINRALQSQLFLAEYGATFGTPYRVIVFGGSGTGASRVTTTAGTASGCTVSGDTLTSTSVGTCLVTAVKAQDKNYETATVTIGVYFLEFVIQQPAPPVSTGPGIALSGITSVTLDPNQAPTISGISVSSGRAGDTVTITGAGFTASALQSVKFWRNIQASVQGTPTNTQIVVLVPAGANTGKIIVITANGSAITEGSFTVLP